PDRLDVVLVGARDSAPDLDGDLTQRLGVLEADALRGPVLVRSPPAVCVAALAARPFAHPAVLELGRDLAPDLAHELGRAFAQGGVVDPVARRRREREP